MKNIIVFSLIISIFSFSSTTWAASCARCYEKIADGKKFCDACRLNISRDLSEMKTKEEQITNTIKSSRESYKKALIELVQFYLDIGNQLRLQKARNELKALNNVPQLKYLFAIEEVNVLFQDGKNYKNMLNLTTSRKSKLSYAVARFKKILDDYPESDKADDAAYELADIYESYHFKDYEGSASYYVKCYELNPNTGRPARYMAARIYDKYLHNYTEAIRNYEMALKTCKDEELLKIANERLEELRKQGY